MKREAYYYFPRPGESKESGETDREETVGTPDWWKDAVIYDILIDSFAVTRRSIGRTNEDTDCDKEYPGRRYGGTIQGVTNNLDYLLKLGINCICLDPFVFKEDHDTSEQTDCLQINPCYGTEADFQFFVDLCHNCAIRVIVDVTQSTMDASPDIDYFGICRSLSEEYSVDGWLFPVSERKEDSFRNSCRDFFAMDTLDAFEFDLEVKDIIHENTANRPFVNLLDSLGKPRFLTYCDGKKERLLLAVLFQMTIAGPPCILYGDEQLILSQVGEECPGPMIWGENPESGMFAFYKAAIYLRRKLGALRNGDYRTRSADKASKLYIYERCQEEQQIIIALNAGEEQAKLPEELGNCRIIWQSGYTSGGIDGYGFLIAAKQPD